MLPPIYMSMVSYPILSPQVTAPSMVPRSTSPSTTHSGEASRDLHRKCMLPRIAADSLYHMIRRKFQCATVQLDFQLPIRFNLEYQTEVSLLPEKSAVANWPTARHVYEQFLPPLVRSVVTVSLFPFQEGRMDRPVIVHRAVLGSVERMFAILTEHFAGKWPFWLNPRQVR